MCKYCIDRSFDAYWLYENILRSQFTAMIILNPYAVIADLAIGIDPLTEQNLPDTCIVRAPAVHRALRNLYDHTQTNRDIGILKAVAQGLDLKGKALPPNAKLDLDVCRVLRQHLLTLQPGTQPVYTSAPSPEAVITTEGSFESLVTFEPPVSLQASVTTSGKPRDAHGRVRMTHAHPDWDRHRYIIMAMHYEGYRYDQIAAVVGVDASQVSKRITQLRDKGYEIPHASTVPPEWRRGWPKLANGDKPLKYKRAWDCTETESLYNLYREGKTLDEMADKLKRFPKDVERKIQIEGLREVDDLRGRTPVTVAWIVERLAQLNEQRALKRVKKKKAFKENRLKKNASAYL